MVDNMMGVLSRYLDRGWFYSRPSFRGWVGVWSTVGTGAAFQTSSWLRIKQTDHHNTTSCNNDLPRNMFHGTIIRLKQIKEAYT